ncbi:sensor histidine kinase [Pseudonocardia sp. GCM10023141]|uniref:sensor histidine kinase n=1 Tax=Pseudonocardia sp. GCM10023141 TaxID=3252653 RepID=UPI00361550EB
MTTLVWALIAAGTLVLGFVVGHRLGSRRTTTVPVPIAPPSAPPKADLLQRVFLSTDEGLVVLNRAGDVELFNARAEELGVVRAGRPDARAAAACQKVLRTGAPTSVDLSPLDHRGRQPAAVLAHVSPLGDGYTMVEADDTSDAVRLEATRRDFVANVSHELKTPVGAVGLLAEAVLDAADDPVEVRRFSTKILNEATRLGNLVTELIALSRLTGAERLPEMTIVDVDEMVSEAMSRSRLSAEAANIEIIVDRPTGLEVEGDLTLLVTALSNLIENAIAYSPAEASVSVSRRRAGDWVEIAVTDRGIGIAPEHQKRVFERFFRVDPARSRATGGTGLGLAIVKHVLVNHGGEVRLWSSPGTGSTFTVRLPVQPTEIDPAESDPAESDPAETDHTAMAGAAPAAAISRRAGELPDRVG